MKKDKGLLENMITIIIFLVLVQTFLADLLVLVSGPVIIRNVLIITGFFFDLFFTVEFLARFFNALLNRRVKKYFFAEYGWIDLLASVPLLLVSSGPSVYALWMGVVFAGAEGILSVLKVVKVVRIARILRILRLLKVFKQIKFIDSKMNQRHTVRIVTTVVSTTILAITLFSGVFAFLSIHDVGVRDEEQQIAIANYITVNKELTGDSLNLYCENEKALLLLKSDGKTIYSRESNEDFKKYFALADYTYVKNSDYEFFFDLQPMQRGQSKSNLIYFFMILMVITIVMVTYSPHFAITVSDPINVMTKGMSSKSYNLEVSIPEECKRDDIFLLAAKYNEEYLPLKARSGGEEGDGAALDIKLEDIEDLLNP